MIWFCIKLEKISTKFYQILYIANDDPLLLFCQSANTAIGPLLTLTSLTFLGILFPFHVPYFCKLTLPLRYSLFLLMSSEKKQKRQNITIKIGKINSCLQRTNSITTSDTDMHFMPLLICYCLNNSKFNPMQEEKHSGQLPFKIRVFMYTGNFCHFCSNYGAPD